MKKLLLIAVMLLTMAGMSIAEPLDLPELIKKVPDLKQGMAYSIYDNNISYLSTFDVFTWKKLTLEAGYSSENKVVTVASYPVLSLKEDFNVNIPILDLINCRVGMYAGFGRLGVTEAQNEFDYGVSATFLSLAF